jgi:hypothetical protein
VGCRGDSRGYPRAVSIVRAGTRGLSLDSPRVTRAAPLKGDGHPPKTPKNLITSMKMQDEGVCTYLVRAEVDLVHCSSRDHDL